MNNTELKALFDHPIDTNLTPAGVVQAAERSRRTRARVTAGVLGLALVASGVGAAWLLPNTVQRPDPAVPSVTTTAVAPSPSPTPSAMPTPSATPTPSVTPTDVQPTRRCEVAPDAVWAQALADAPGEAETRVHAPDRASWVAHSQGTITWHSPDTSVTVTTQADAMYGLLGYDGRFVLLSVGEHLQVWDADKPGQPRQVGSQSFPGDGENRAYLDRGTIWLATVDGASGRVVSAVDAAGDLTPREVVRAENVPAGSLWVDAPVGGTLQVNTGGGFRRYAPDGTVTDWPGEARGHRVLASSNGTLLVVDAATRTAFLTNERWADTMPVSLTSQLWGDYLLDVDRHALFNLTTGASITLPQSQAENQDRFAYQLRIGMLEVTDMSQKLPRRSYVDLTALPVPNC